MTKSEFSALLNNSSEFRKVANCDDGTQWFTGLLNDKLWDHRVPGDWVIPSHQFSGSVGPNWARIVVDIK